MLSMPSSLVKIPDKNLQKCINACIVKLTANAQPSSEIVGETLDAIELEIVRYTNKYRAEYFKLLNAKAHIKKKKTQLIRLMQYTQLDIAGICVILGKYNDLFAHISKDDISGHHCAKKIEPVFIFLRDVLNEMMRINAYENGIKDVLKQVLARMHIAMMDFFFAHKNYTATIYHLQEKMTIADSMVSEQLKQSICDVSDTFILAMHYFDIEDVARVENIMRLERERCITLPELYVYCCQRISKMHSLNGAYPQAIKWINEALNLGDNTLLRTIRAELINENLIAINNHFKNIDRMFLLAKNPELKDSYGSQVEPDYLAVIVVAIAEWSPSLIAKFKQLAGKFLFDFPPGKLIVHQLSKVGVVGLKNVYKAIHKLELQYQNGFQEASTLPAEQSIDTLSSRMAALAIHYPVADITPVCSLTTSSSVASCSTDPVSQDRIKPAIKTKTRGKADRRKQAVQAKATTQVVTCDAERYGFSRELFGMHKFNACRMRGDNNRLFYVVTGEIAATNKRGDNHQKFARLMDDPKIVPPCGEEGFKWMQVEGKKVLVGKVLDTKKRLFPTVTERNDQGAIAFLYGTIVNTKNGIPDIDVKHYIPTPKKP